MLSNRKAFGRTLTFPAKSANKGSDPTDILEDEWHAFEHINIKYEHISMRFHLNGDLFFFKKKSGLGLYSPYSDSRN